MLLKKLSNFLLLPELKLLEISSPRNRMIEYKLLKESAFEVCPKCATRSNQVHDRRWVKIKDAPIGGKIKILEILKRRFRCPQCKSVFTEPVKGINKHAKITQRLQRYITWACDNYVDLKRVRKDTECGNSTIYKRFYKQLELKEREMHNTPWSSSIGIDEHSFIRNKKRGHRDFATIIVDQKNKKIREVVYGRDSVEMQEALSHIPGRENVKNACIDLSIGYKSFITSFFPNAKIIADKFHVIRLLNNSINKYRKQITGDVRKNPIRKLLLKSSIKLDYFERKVIFTWLENHPELKQIYLAKEALQTMYRCRGKARAAKSLTNLTDALAITKVPELKSLRNTLMKWRKEILNYFESRITNGRTEGFNNVAKTVQKRAYGYKSFKNYRLRLLSACC